MKKHELPQHVLSQASKIVTEPGGDVLRVLNAAGEVIWPTAGGRPWVNLQHFKAIEDADGVDASESVSE